jgi:hypothetical protein
LSHEVLALTESAPTTPQVLFDFVVEELALREPEDLWRIRTVGVVRRCSMWQRGAWIKSLVVKS